MNVLGNVERGFSDFKAPFKVLSEYTRQVTRRSQPSRL
jgi:hypothetical protein